MNSSEPMSVSAAPRRSYGKWIFIGLGVLMTPVLILGLAVWSMISLDRDAALLRREVMVATGSDWHTRVQLDVGGVTLGLARVVLHFVHHEHIDDARLALAAVRNASVGVYERDRSESPVDARRLFDQTDKLMRARGWTRLVGVMEGRQNVLIYSSDRSRGDRMDLCLAVVDGKELVVVATCVDAAALAQLLNKHVPEGFKSKLKLAKLDF